MRRIYNPDGEIWTISIVLKNVEDITDVKVVGTLVNFKKLPTRVLKLKSNLEPSQVSDGEIKIGKEEKLATKE
jgi:hypothetical protein